MDWHLLRGGSRISPTWYFSCLELPFIRLSIQPQIPGTHPHQEKLTLLKNEIEIIDIMLLKEFPTDQAFLRILKKLSVNS